MEYEFKWIGRWPSIGTLSSPIVSLAIRKCADSEVAFV
jgi:hypothetical protein